MNDQMDVLEHLQMSELFGELEASELAGLVPLFQCESWAENQVLFAEGELAEKLMIVVTGKLALDKKIQLGRSGQRERMATIGYVEDGETAGWSSLAMPYIYTTTAVALEPSCALVADGVRLREYLRANPLVGFKVMGVVARVAGSRYKDAMSTLVYFLSIVSHELRAPLAAVENYLHVMLEGFAGEISDKQRRMLGRSISRVHDLRALIGDLVDLARMRPEQIQADFEWLDPSEVGAESIEDVRLAAAEKEIKIKVDRPPEFFKVVGARRRLRQVFTNLLSNAIKFSPEGSSVTFRAYYTPRLVVFEIDDEGIGISPQDQAHIFDEFFRADNVSQVAGLGLGLSIAKKIVEAHRGQIVVQSPYSPDKPGTRFTVSMPRDLQTPDEKRSGGIPMPPPGGGTV
ncbi:MAG: cyclic nucleotide-binding domain-containing protein [Thermoflexales bacterium]|nr:cyclic nucleotide-binding domain-containing protein [Thermoflexales bacterium]